MLQSGFEVGREGWGSIRLGLEGMGIDTPCSMRIPMLHMALTVRNNSGGHLPSIWGDGTMMCWVCVSVTLVREMIGSWGMAVRVSGGQIPQR
jgi:hypothetical protein